jgi:monoamine oxidase
MGDKRQVIVMGGGAAGLAAATTIAAAGVDVLLLEARTRLGGRVLTQGSGGDEPLELGAEFVHGDAPRTTALAQAAGIELLETKSAARWSRDGALVEAPDLSRAASEATEAATRISGQGDDRSFADAIDAARVPEPGRSLALEYVQSFEAADAHRLSVRAFAMGDLGSDRARRVPAGYARLMEALAQRLPEGSTRLGAVVRDVRWSRGSASVATTTTLDGPVTSTLTCDRLVVALPLATLGDIHFAPRLEAKQGALGLLTTGVAMRLALRFHEAFWRDRLPAPAFVRVRGGPFPVYWTGPRPDSRVLNGWVGGPAATRLRGLHTERLTERALDTLSHVFGLRQSALESSLRDAHFHDWLEDPFARGAYSYSLVGGAEAPRALAVPLDDTLFFAGEATCDPPENGTVEGALETGFRAAREVLGSLGR